MRLFDGILRFARTGVGDVLTLQGEPPGRLRLRLGDYRVLFTIDSTAMRIFGVRHRPKAYE
jgi:mRNA-degrading endonuclease RelE of RelBE toxin-antitoxin system